MPYIIDWSKVTTLEHIKELLQCCDMQPRPSHPMFFEIEHLCKEIDEDGKPVGRVPIGMREMTLRPEANADEVDPAIFEEKIRDGIDQLIKTKSNEPHPITMSVYGDRIWLALQQNKKPRLSDLKMWWLWMTGQDLCQIKQYTVYANFIEEEGGFSVIAENMPGCVSMGVTKEEARANIKEAAEGWLESYLDDCEEVPLREVDITKFESIEVEVRV